MALFGMEIKRRSKKAGTFHVDNLAHSKRRGPKRSMSNTRLFMSAVSLFAGGVMCYSAVHYVPAFLGTSKVLDMARIDTSAARLHPENRKRNILAPYLDHFKLRRTFLRSGQRIQAQYSMPRGAVVELRIRQCEKNFVIEVFECNVISEKTVRVSNKTTGTQEFVFQNSGFFMFDERLISSPRGADTAAVTWRRG